MTDTIFAVLSIIGGAAFAVIARILVRKGHATKGWAPTPGIVLESEPRPTGEGYYPHVLYRYDFDGRTYESSEIASWRFESTFASTVRRVTDRYPVGGGVIAYVNPANPSEALLQTGYSRVLSWGLILGAVVSIVIGFHRLFSG